MAIISPASTPRDKTPKEITYDPCDLSNDRRGVTITCRGVKFPIDNSELLTEIAKLPGVDAFKQDMSPDVVVVGLMRGMSAQQANQIALEISKIVSTPTV